MVEIKRDLKSTITDVSSVAEALKHLQGVATSLFGVLGNLTETFGSQVGRAAQVAGSAATPGDFITATGRPVAQEYITHVAAKATNDFISATESTAASGRAEALAARGALGVIKTSALPGISEKYPWAPKFLRVNPATPLSQQRVEIQESMRRAFERSGEMPGQFEMARELGLAGHDIRQTQQTPSSQIDRQTQVLGAGYSMSDLGRITNLAKDYTGGQQGARIAEVLKKLEQNSDDTSKVLASELARLRASIQENTHGLANATREYKETKSPQAAARAKALMGGIERETEELSNILKHGGGGGDGGGGVGGFGYHLQRLVPRIGAVAGAALGVAQAGLQSQLLLGETVLGKELKAEQLSGDIAGSIFGMQSGAYDMTRPENLLRYRADILFPQNKYKFIGTKGVGNALESAIQNEKLKIDLEGQKRFLGVMGGLGTIGTGVAGVVAGSAAALPGAAATGGATAALGVGMAAGGATNIARGTADVLASWISSPYTAMEGGLESGSAAAVGRLFYKDWDQMAPQARRAALLQSRSEMIKTVDDYQKAELAQNPESVAALGEYEAMMKAQRQAAILVGGYAMSAKDVLGEIAKQGTMSQESIDYNRNIEFAQGQKFSLKAKQGIDLYASMKQEEELLRPWVEQKETPGILDQAFNALARVFGAKDVPDPEGDKRREEYEALKSQVDSYNQQIIAANGNAAALEKVYEGIANTMAVAQGNAKEDLEKSIDNNKMPSPFGDKKPRITSRFGWRTIDGKRQFHAGTDAAVPIGTPILASGSGKVVKVWYDDLSGNAMRVGYGNGLIFGYAHMKDGAALKVGDVVEVGAKLGEVGMTGRTKGSHLHQTVVDEKTGRFIDPESVIDFGQSAQKNLAARPQAAASATPQPITKGSAHPRTTYSELGVSPAEFIMKNAELTNVLGSYIRNDQVTGLKAGEATTAQMIKLGYSGLGSFEQQVGSIAALNKVAGGQSNIQLLEHVLAAAVAAGFDKSRTAQAFVRSTTEVMGTLKTTTAMTGGLMSTAATALGGGLADERSMAVAAAGLKSYGAYTGQVSGLPGAVKSISAAQAGFGLGTGFATALNMNAIERMDVIKQLEGGGTLSTSAMALMASRPGESRKQIAERLKKMVRAEGAQAEALLKMGGFESSGMSIAEIKAKLLDKNLDQKERAALIEKTLRRTLDPGAALEMGAESAVGAGINMIQSWGVKVAREDMDLMKNRIIGGGKMAIDPAVINQRRYMDRLIANLGANIKQNVWNSGDYKRFLDSGGAPWAISVDAAREVGNEKLAGTPITEDLKGPALAAAKKTLSGISTFDLARSSEISAQQQIQGMQAVTIHNWNEITPYMTHAILTAKNPEVNSRDGVRLNPNLP